MTKTFRLDYVIITSIGDSVVKIYFCQSLVSLNLPPKALFFPQKKRGKNANTCKITTMVVQHGFLSYDLSGGHGGHVHRIAGGQVRARAAGTKSPNCSSSAATATHHHHPCPPGGSSAFYTHTNTHFNTFLKVEFLDWCHRIFIVEEVKRHSLVDVVKV